MSGGGKGWQRQGQGVERQWRGENWNPDWFCGLFGRSRYECFDCGVGKDIGDWDAKGRGKAKPKGKGTREAGRELEEPKGKKATDSRAVGSRWVKDKGQGGDLQEEE